jgi:hypothetical protein
MGGCGAVVGGMGVRDGVGGIVEGGIVEGIITLSQTMVYC